MVARSRRAGIRGVHRYPGYQRRADHRWASSILPDLAGLPGPGQMRVRRVGSWCRSTTLDIGAYKAETSPASSSWHCDGQIYGVFIGPRSKGLIGATRRTTTAPCRPPGTSSPPSPISGHR